MPIIRIKVRSDWHKELETAAKQRGCSIEDLVLSVIEPHYPPPEKGRHPIDCEPLVQHAQEVCLALDKTRADLVAALGRLQAAAARRPRTRIKDKEERRRTGQRLREATMARGWRQQDIAGMLKVHRSVVAHVMAGDYRVPPAWMPDLNRLFGENWMSE